MGRHKKIPDSPVDPSAKLAQDVSRATGDHVGAPPTVPSSEEKNPDEGKVKRPRVDPEAEGRDVVEMLSAFFSLLTDKELPEKEREFDRRTIEGYAERYRVRPSLWLLHGRAFFGIAWFFKSLYVEIKGKFSKEKKPDATCTDMRPNGERKNLPG